jgi:hypothetical protein
MAGFRDRALLALSDPGTLAGLLLPSGDTTGARVRTLLAATYDLSAARVDTVSSVAVRDVALERALFPVGRQRGEWSQTVPSFTRAEFSVSRPAPADPVWIDLLARLDVTLVTEVDPGGAEQVLAQGIEFATLDEFRAKVPFLDVDAFLAERHITTVEQLREAAEFIVAEVHLRKPGRFDPDDPGNIRVLPVSLAAVIVDPVDLAGGLRATRLVREAARDLAGTVPAAAPAESTEAYATAVVLDAGGLPAGITPAKVEALFALEGVACLFPIAA